MGGIPSKSQAGRDAAPAIPDVQSDVGPYRLLSLIGEGGMGRVYRVRHRGSGEELALKTVNRMARHRALALRAEAAALRSVRHPGIVRIVDEGTHEGTPWYAMELLTGSTIADYNAELWEQNIEPTVSGVSRSVSLIDVPPEPVPAVDSWLGRGRRSRLSQASLTHVLRLYRELCEPLSHIHARGMVHRDLKPANVFIRRHGGPVLMDFGLTGFASGGVGREVLDPGNRGFGTPQYTAPERVDGQLDARSDLYSLGCMMFETLVGHPPFHGDRRHVVSQHRHAPPAVPSELVDGVPPEVDALVLELLQKEPHARIVQASDVASRLCGILGERQPDVPGPATLYRPQLSGREQSLQQLRQKLEAAGQGRGGMVLVSGVSGVGKTFLTMQFALDAVRGGVRVVTGEALPTGEGPPALNGGSTGPLHALRRLLQSIADTCREQGEQARDQILADRAVHLAPFEPSLEPFVKGEHAAGVLPPAAATERVLVSLQETLKAYARHEPLVLILDDLHWADDLTLKLLLGLEPRFFDSVPLLVVGTYRTEEASGALQRLLGSGAATSLPLSSLGEVAVERMIGDMLCSPAPQHLVDALLEESGGNPFFVAEYMRYLASEGLLKRRRGTWVVQGAGEGDGPDYHSIGVPHSLGDLLERRLQALSANSRRTIEACAVLGRSFRIDTLALTLNAPEETLMGVLGEAQERQVISVQNPDEYRFLHDKLREASYQAIPSERRRALHSRAALALDALGTSDQDHGRLAAQLARHQRLAGNLEAAVGWLEKAADAALGLSSQRDAAGYLAQALELAEQIPAFPLAQRARWQRALGSALHDVGEFEAGNRHLIEALRLHGETVPFGSPGRMALRIVWEVMRQSAHRFVRWHRWGGAARERERALECARCLDRLQQAYYYAGDALPMAYSCFRTLNMSEAAGASAQLTIAYANARAVAGVMPSRSLATVYERLAHTNMQAAPDPVAETYFLTLQGVHSTGLCAWSDARDSIERGLEIAQRLDYARRVRELSGLASTLAFFMGDYREAKRSAEVLRALAVKTDAHTHCWGLLCRAQASLCQGAVEEAQSDVDQARAIADDLWKPERIWARGLEASLAAHSGAWGRADEASRLALEEIAQVPTATHHTVDAYARIAETRIALCAREAPARGSRRLASAALGSIRQLAKVFPLAEPRYYLLYGYLAEANRKPDRAVAHYEASLRRSLELGMPYDEARARLALADHIETGGHRQRARELLLDQRAELRFAKLCR